VIRSYCYPLKPNRAQEEALNAFLVACQQLYNGALEERIGAYRRQRKTVTKYDQFKELTTLRAEDPAYAAVPARILRSPIERLDRAYQAFFRRVKNGEKPGFPRFRSQDRYDSFSFPTPSVKGDRVLIPNLGHVRFNRYREIPEGAPIKGATVKRAPKGWEISFVCDLGQAPKKKVDSTRSVGVDLGLKSFAVLSTGEEITKPRFLKVSAGLVARRQRSLVTKKRGSNSRKRAKNLVARAHLRVHNQRLDFARKLAKDLVTRFDVICHEDLDVRGLIEKEGGPRLSKSISDAAWSLFLRCLAPKAEEAGKLAVGVNPRGTTQRCSGCGKLVPKTLRDR
jgi:putative transposase